MKGDGPHLRRVPVFRLLTERRQEAKAQYERAVALLQEGKSPEEALERLDRAIGYNPTYGDAYMLKSHVQLEVMPNLDDALASGLLAVKFARKIPTRSIYSDSFTKNAANLWKPKPLSGKPCA